MKKNLLTGTFWLSVSNIICKVLGIAYLIPWLTFIGSAQDQQTAQALYNVAYLPYALFLSLGTAGFPSGIAKKIAHLNSVQNKNSNQKLDLFRSGLAVMEVIGIIAAILMFLVAPVLSHISPLSDHRAGIIAIRSLCLSLLIIPILSALRGYFQGVNLTIPFGISQIIEQVVRVIVILIGTYLIRIVFHGSVISAVLLSTAASAVGGIFSIIYLLWIGRKRKVLKMSYFLSSPWKAIKKNKGVALEIIKESLPFVYVGAVISLMQLIDQISLKPIYSFLFPSIDLSGIEMLFTLSSANPNKLAPILLSLISSITITSLPLLSVVKTRIDRQSTIADILRLTLTFLAPASIGMLILSFPLNTIFFGFSIEGSIYLGSTIISMFFLGIFTVLLSILQALDAHREAVNFTSRLLLFKVVFQLPCIFLFKGLGLSLSTTFSTIIISIIVYRFIVSKFNIHPISYTKNYFYRVIDSSLIMGFSCFVLFVILTMFLEIKIKVQSVLLSVIIACFGSLIFLCLLFKDRIYKAFLKKM